jgi:hypothetical protein
MVATVIPAIIVTIFAVSSVAAGGNAGKVALCHWANHKFVKINVSMNAEPAHLRHGDVVTDEYGECSTDQSSAGSAQDD